jgi:hypothetical protein
MSLINEALKRAQQTQQENPPLPPPLEFRPVESASPSTRHTTLIIVGLALVVLALLGLTGLLISSFGSHSNQKPLTVAARTVVQLAPLPFTNAAASAASVTNAIVPTALAPTDSAAQPATNAVSALAAVTPEIVQPAPMKLQGIFFNPQRPSVVVNGQTLYLGDWVNGFRLVGISPVAVTLVSATGTNVLSLSGN